jgi:uncharacterized protein (TIGR02246 family)
MSKLARNACLLLLLLAPGVVLADPAAEVRCREIAFSRSVETNDAEAFAAFVHPDARFIGADVSRGREAVVAAWRSVFGPEAPDMAWRPQFVEVVDNGALALSRGPYRIVGVGPDGQTVERWGTFNSVWQQQSDGRWLVLFDAGSQPIETPSAEARSLLDAPLPDCD